MKDINKSETENRFERQTENKNKKCILNQNRCLNSDVGNR